MRVIPSKRVCEKFKLVYELQGAQKAVDFLASYYGIAKMRVKVDGKRVGDKNDAVYDNNVAYFRKDRLNRVLILHEFFHHLVHIKNLNMLERREEREAHRYARLLRE